MNQETRYVLSFYEIALVLRDTLEYGIPGVKEFPVKSYETRKAMLTHLLGEKMPFEIFVSQNGEVGAKIKDQLHEFYDDVYGDSPRIVRKEGEGIVVESSLVIQLLDYVVGLHETISDLLHGFMNEFKKNDKLEDELVQLVNEEDRFYRTLATRVLLVNSNFKFKEFNEAVQLYVNKVTKETGVDPRNQPDFNPGADPSVSFISNELRRVVGLFRFVKQHNHCQEFDPFFTNMLEEVENKIHLYDGSRKPQPGQKMEDALKDLENTMVPFIEQYRAAWAKSFNPIFESLRKFEEEMMAQQQANASKGE